MWQFSAAVCINDQNEILMVLQQGYENKDKKWSVPSGRKKPNESFKECCIRETYEETGYLVKVEKQLFQKDIIAFNKPAPVKYYKVRIVGGEATIQDPDHLIYDIKWITKKQLKTLKLSFPEDRETLLKIMG
ncbi:NUDIX hydrolase [Clostridium sp. 'deep sea']|uniref:NUDIX hydrolase n=1 Tax=Clostridium sp. 'deep sea' TaxID=2779445 RepID=UPI00189662B1|nr:NUDIX hydrolase [Clostridium sp. 'deep sea']QOR36096.1 NUDIX hydrolase [Clostridium sp. 'deep sea']